MGVPTSMPGLFGSGLAASRPSSPTPPPGGMLLWYSTDTGEFDVWYDGASSWSQFALVPYSGGGGATNIDPYAPPTAAQFATIINGGSGSPAPSVANVSNLGMVLDSGPTLSGSGDPIRAAMKASLGASFTISARLRVTKAPNTYRGGGLILADGTRFILFHEQWNGTTGDVLNVTQYTNSTTFSSNAYQSGALGGGGWEYKRIQSDGTNLYFMVSRDATNWVTVYQESLGAFLSTITYYGLGADANCSGTPPGAGDHIYVACPWWTDTSP